MGRGGVGFNPARDCDAVVRDVRRRTARERVRITDLFKDFDRHQHGEREDVVAAAPTVVARGPLFFVYG